MSEIDTGKCRITHYPAAVLAEQARPIEKIDDNIRRLAEKMTEIMLRNKGVGLAGPQAGVSLQIFIIGLDGTKDSVRVYINPKVTPYGTLEAIEEGCLSVPDICTKMRRYKRCKVTATGLDGKEFTDEAEGLYARVLQHENDHLNGITILNRMGTAAKIKYRRQIKELKEGYKADN